MVPLKANDDTMTARPKRKKFKLKKKAAIALAVMGIGAVCLMYGANKDIENNKARRDLIDSSTEVSCHITSVEEKERTMVMDDNVVTNTTYNLVGTYNYNDQRCIVTLSDSHVDKAMADKYINTDRDIYISNDRIGIAGITDVEIPPIDKSAYPSIIFGSVIAALGLVILFIPNKRRKITKKRTFQSA